jgi:hypothetical protein
LGTLLQIAGPSQHLLLYWPRPGASPSGWLESWAWGQLFVLLLVALLAVFVGFVVGWIYSGIFRGQKLAQGTSGLEDLEAETNYLQEQTDKVEFEVNELWRKMQWTPYTRPANASVRARSYQQPGRSGWFTGRLGRLFGRGPRGKAEPTTGNGADAGIDAAALTERVRNVKLQVVDVKNKLRHVAPYLAAAPWSQGSQKKEDPSTPHHGTSVPTNEASDDDTLPRIRDTAVSSEGGGPTISSPHRDQLRSAHAKKATRGDALPPAEAEIVELYNRAVTDPFAREQFRERYQAVRVGTVNAVERSQNLAIEAEYKETSDGDFLAVAIAGGDAYAVVPRLGLTIESVRYTAGALGVVFGDTRGHDPQHFYSRYRVLRPAKFKRRGDRWELSSPGELELGTCD